MAIVERRVFFGKPGTADAIVDICKEFIELMKSDGGTGTPRVMTDHLSGRTDRVVMEMQADSLGDIEADMASAMTDEEMSRKFGASFARLAELITHAEVDYWTLR